MNYYEKQAATLQLGARQVFVILVALNRRQELIRLEHWARHKGLAAPSRSYRQQRFDAERRLFQHSHATPLTYQCAIGLHWLNRLLSPTPRYLPKGSAGAYRYLKSESRHYRNRPIVKLF